MRLSDILSNTFVSNTTGGVILGGSASSILSISTAVGAILGLGLGLYVFYKTIKKSDSVDL